MKKKRYAVFLSYKRQTADGSYRGIEIARSIGLGLNKFLSIHTKSECFFDFAGMPKDEDFHKCIEDVIKSVRVFVCILTKNTLQSENVRKEILFAKQYKKKIILINYCNTFSFSQDIPKDFPKELDFVKNLTPETLHNDNSHDKTLKGIFEENIYPELRPKIFVHSDIKYSILCPGKEIRNKQLGKDCFELTLPQTKEKYKITFVNKKDEADCFDYYVNVQDLDFKRHINVSPFKQQKEHKTKEEHSSPNQTKQGASKTTIASSRNIVETTSNHTSARTYKIGDYYDDGRMKGVVFDVTADGKHGKIVSLIESNDDLQWAVNTKVQEQLIGAEYEYNGANNMAKVMQIDNWRKKYPAFAWCADLGEDWYLPAIEELMNFTLNEPVHDAVNHSLNLNNGKAIANKGIYKLYWSSTEYEDATSDTLGAWYVDMCECESLHEDKVTYRYVRAVAKF